MPEYCRSNSGTALDGLIDLVVIGELCGVDYKSRRTSRDGGSPRSQDFSKEQRRVQWQFRSMLNKLTTRGRVACRTHSIPRSCRAPLTRSIAQGCREFSPRCVMATRYGAAPLASPMSAPAVLLPPTCGTGS